MSDDILLSARRAQGLTQLDLATRANTSQSTISRLERRKVGVRVALARRLAALLQVPLDAVLVADAPADHEATAAPSSAPGGVRP